MRRLVAPLVVACAFCAFSAPAFGRPTSTYQWSARSPSSQVSEGAGSATFEVRRTKSKGPATISYGTVDGAATAPDDYTATSGTLKFRSGQSTLLVTVPIIDDTIIEPRFEDFGLDIFNSSKGIIAAPSASVDIADNDGTVSLDTSNWTPSSSIGQHNFENVQNTSFTIDNSGTRDALVDVSGSTNGFQVGNFATPGCDATGDGTPFSCSGVPVGAGSSATVTFTVAIPSCNGDDITMTLDTLADSLFTNQNASPTLSHTYTRTLSSTECPS